MVEKEIELLPCPFCGSMPIEEYSGSWLVVTCSDDSCVLGNMAITTIGWNRRATTDREKRLVEALEHPRAVTRITYAKDQVWIDFYANRSTAILHYRERKGDWLNDGTEDSDWEFPRKWKEFKSIEEAFAFLTTKSVAREHKGEK